MDLPIEYRDIMPRRSREQTDLDYVKMNKISIMP